MHLLKLHAHWLVQIEYIPNLKNPTVSRSFVNLSIRFGFNIWMLLSWLSAGFQTCRDHWCQSHGPVVIHSGGWENLRCCCKRGRWVLYHGWGLRIQMDTGLKRNMMEHASTGNSFQYFQSRWMNADMFFLGSRAAIPGISLLDLSRRQIEAVSVLAFLVTYPFAVFKVPGTNPDCILLLSPVHCVTCKSSPGSWVLLRFNVLRRPRRWRRCRA